MDDMYQYAASAVNSNNKDQIPVAVSEEDDVIIKAFNNISWGKKWSSLVDTVKKQSEAFVEGTKKDLQEFSQILTEDAEEDQASIDAGASRQVATENEHSALDSIRESLSKINTVSFTSLRDGLTQTLNQSLPTQITTVRLPENMDLTQLKEGLTNGTRSAEHYLQKFGTDVISALKNTVTVLEPEEQASTAPTTVENASRSPRIFATRKDALMAKMQTNENTYLQDPDLAKEDYDQEKKILDTFNSSFNIEEYTDEIAQLLEEYPSLRETMDRLVPVQVSYKLFWQRYFYHAWKIDQDEQKRQIIVQGAQEEEAEADFKWDSDDEDNTTVKNVVTNKDAEEDKSKIRTSTSNSDDTDDFSQISEPTSSSTSPPLKSSHAEDEWVKAEKKKSDDEEDSDSDWE